MTASARSTQVDLFVGADAQLELAFPWSVLQSMVPCGVLRMYCDSGSQTSLVVSFWSAICILLWSCGGGCPSGTERRGDVCRKLTVAADAGGGESMTKTGSDSLPVGAEEARVGDTAQGSDRVGDTSTGSTGDMQSSSMLDATDGGATTMITMTADAGPSLSADAGSVLTGPEPCTDEGAQRCSHSQRGREQCEQGVWASLDDCPESELCTLREGTPACAVVAELCRGSDGQPVCDAQGTLLFCRDDGTLAGEPMACKSARLCQDGVSAGKCAECIANEEYRCTGTALELCAADGMSFAAAEQCQTEALCNAIAGTCTTAACSPNAYSCQGNTLQKCRADGTGFDEASAVVCGDRSCDAAGGDCNMCEPGQKTCVRNAIMTCDDSGQELVSSACPAGTRCVGAGQCVECEVDADCGELTRGCTAGACEGYRCVSRRAVEGTQCTTNSRPGTCTAAGACMCAPQCDKPCGADGCGGQCPNRCGSQKCVDDTCKECDPANGRLDCLQPNNPCQERICQSDDSCSAPRPKANGTCDGICLDGECVDCLTGRDCASGHCTNHRCTQCDQTGGCEKRSCQRESCTSEGACRWTPSAAGASCGNDGKVCNSNGGCIDPVYDRCTASGDVDDPSRACTTRGKEGTCVDDGYCAPLCSGPGDCLPITGASVSCEYLCIIKCPCPDGMRCGTNNNCMY